MAWLTTWLGRNKKTHTRRMRLEQFEDRVVPAFVGPLAEVPRVQPGQMLFLAAGPHPHDVHLDHPFSNVSAADTTNTDQLWPSGGLGLNLTGAGYTVGVWESGGGRIRNSHQEFGGRATDGDSGGTLSDHATHVAGTIGAAGVNPTARGMANQVGIRGFNATDDMIELAANAASIVASNHSYGTYGGWDFGTAAQYGIPGGFGTQWFWLADRSLGTEDEVFGRYGAKAVATDTVLAANPMLLSVYSAGNDRNDGPGSGVTQYVTYFSSDPGNIGGWSGAGWYFAPNSGPTTFPGSDGNNGTGYDSLSGDRVIKNGFLVGAINRNDNDPTRTSDIVMSNFSGWGPTDDGRVKPDLVAAGVNLNSSISTSDSDYSTMSGTSMAAPNATGTAVLLVQYYEQQYGVRPTAATLRALMTHTAFDAGTIGPDYVYGFGVLDAAASINHIRQAKAGSTILQEGTYTGSKLSTVFTAKGGLPIKATIAWTDPAGTAKTGLDDPTPVLVNDLDIYAVGPDGQVYQAWKLNPAAPNSGASRYSGASFLASQGNRVDNIEQVMIDAPIAGAYTIYVRHEGASFTQNFSLLVSEAGDRFERNETLATAANVGVAPGVNIDGLTIHSSTDNDWYRFEVLRTDNLRVKVSFPAAQGNLDMQVTNSLGTVLASGTTGGDNETLDMNGLAPGTYYVRVFGAVGATNAYSLSIAPAPGSTTKVYYVNDSRFDDGVYALAAGNDANDGLTPTTPKATVESVLSTYSLGATSLVAIDTGTYSSGTVTITVADEGAIYAGSPLGSNFSYGGTRFDIVDADFNIFHGLGFTGSGGTGVYLRPGAVDPSSNNRIIAGYFSGTNTAIRLERGSGNSFESNTITGSGSNGISVTDQASGTSIIGNTISGRDTGIALNGTFTSTTISANSVSGSASYALYTYGTSSTAITGNTFAISTRGLYAYANAGLTITGNTITGNTTGVETDTTIGGTSWTAGQPNDINNNFTGVSLFNGASVRFNRIHHNAYGITTANNTAITNNEIYRNSVDGILVDNDNTVSILSNTMYAAAGDAVRLRNFSQGVTLRNNILHVENGYALSVTNDSQTGLVSDYNNLYSTGAGRPVWFQKEFADLFDWQVESGYDTHSIGRTALAPTLDDPLYVNLAGDNYTLTSVSTSIDAGDPASLVSSEPAPNGGRINLGAHGNTALATASKGAYLELNYPSYYTDWEFQESRPILWRGVNVSGNLSIDLVEEGSGTVRHIADAPVANGSYTWIPSTTPGVSSSVTARHRIRITSLLTPAILANSREAFSITANTPDYYVNDVASAMDEYTSAAGDNRKTGKTPADPKSSLVALLQSYHLEPGDTVRIDAGTYNHVRNVIISGNLAIGDDEGATFLGATGSKGGSTVLDRANTFNQSTNIELNDGDEVTLKYLTLQGANRGLWVRNNSIRFDGYQLVTRNNTADGLIIESDSEQTTVDQLSSYGNGGNGISINAGIGSLFNSEAYSNGGSGIILGGNFTAIRNIKTYNNTQTGLALSSTGNAIVELVEAYGNTIGISVANSSGTTVIGNDDLSLSKGNRIHDNGTGIVASGGGVLVVGNSITSNTTGVSINGSKLEHNVISGGSIGVSLYSSGTIQRNRIYGAISYGISAIYGGKILENTIYSNGTGIIASYYAHTIRNNLVYANTNAGIVSNGVGTLISNNTVYQTSGDGLLITGATSNTVQNNILWTTSGAALSIASDSQNGFTSDYNLLLATGTGSVGRWQNVLRPTLNAWQNAAFTDANSISQNPLFVDLDGADNMLGYISVAIDGRDDNFHVQSDSTSGSFPGSLKNGSLVPVLSGGLPVMLAGTWSVDGSRSPTLDRGNPISSYANEPTPNGAYVDLGAFGNTEQTSRSPAQYILTTRPDGGEIWPAAQTFAVRWRADNFGGVSSLDFDGSDDHAIMPHSASQAFANAAPITLEAWIKPDTFANYGATILAKGRTGGNESANYALRLGNGNYNDRRLLFYYRSGSGNFNTFTSTNEVINAGEWQHVALTYTFGTAASAKLYVNGAEVPGTWTSSTGNEAPVSTTDPLWIGAINGVSGAPVEEPFDGQIDDVRIWNVTRSPVQIAANVNNSLTGGETGLVGYWKFDEPSGTVLTDSSSSANHGSIAVAAPARVLSSVPLSRVDVDLVNGSGAFVASIASATPNDGEYLWTIPEAIPPGTDYKVRVRRSDLPVIADSSNATFEITAKISFYYVNDASIADGGDLTTAAGSDANNGLSPATPKASIRSVLETYDLGPGDVILVDGGTYALTANILVTNDDTGVTIRGNPANDPTLNRGNIAAGAAGFEVSGADDITIENLTVTGAYDGIWTPANAGTDRLTMRRVWLKNNSHYGLNADGGNTEVRFEDGTASGSYTGIYIFRNSHARVINSDVYSNSYTGVELDGHTLSLTNKPRIEGSRVRENVYGINAFYGADAADNQVWNNSSYGINIYASGGQITGNRVWGHAAGTGIYAYSADTTTLIENNRVFSNSIGMAMPYSTAQIRGNRVYDNSKYGMNVGPYSTPVSGNLIYSNAIGITVDYYASSDHAIENNLIYANTTYGIEVRGANRRFLNNTIYQPVGDAFHFENGPGATLRNNIIEVGNGAGLFVDAGSVSGLTANYDLFRTSGTGVAALWEGVTFADRTELTYETGQELNGLVGDAKFNDIDGPDNLLGFSTASVAGTNVVQDDGAAMFTGSWGAVGAGLGGGLRATPSSNDPLEARTATWTFTGLDPNATYEVAATWNPSASWSNQSRFTARDAAGAAAFTTRVNQQLAPSDYSADGAAWKRLGRVVPTGTSFSLVLDNINPVYFGSVAADGVRIVKLVADAGADDNFRVLGGSPSIDAGELISAFVAEPAPNGGRVNLGHTGNTADATASPSKFIQVLSPTDIGKVEVGATSTLHWRNFGLPTVSVPPGVNAAFDAGPVAYYRLGDTVSAQVGDVSGNHRNGIYENGVTQGVAGINGLDSAASFDGVNDRISLPTSGFSDFTGGLSFSLWVNPAADSNYSGFVDLGNGSYLDRILFARYFSTDTVYFYVGGQQLILGGIVVNNVWQHLAVTMAADKTVRIYRNGTLMASQVFSSLPSDVARNQNFIGSTVDNYRFNGKLDEVAIYNRALTPAEITSLASPASYGLFSQYGNVKLDLYQSGAFVQAITASTLNTGSFMWSVPGGLPTGAGYQVRVSTLDNITQGTSAPFRVVPGGNQFYVATTGDNANSGRSPGEPMRTVRALVNAYDLDAGDVVNVAAGTYRHVTNVILATEDSGVRITGPAVSVGAPPAVIINRGNSTLGNAVFQVSGADDVTIDDLTATGARDGIWLPISAGSDRLTLNRLRLEGNSNTGLNADLGNTAVRFLDGVATRNNIGIVLNRIAEGLIQNADIYSNSGNGVELSGATLAFANRPRIETSRIRGNGAYGLYLDAGASATGNNVWSNSSGGIYAYGSGSQITANRTFGHTANAGIYTIYGDSSTLIEDNESFSNATGLSLNYFSGTARGNRLYDNSGDGLYFGPYASTVVGNTIYSNSTGIRADGYGSFDNSVENNLVYGNANYGIRIQAPNRRIINNTVYQSVGDAIRLENATGTVLANNILQTATGAGLSVDAGSVSGLVSDYNLYRATGSGVAAVWEGITFTDLAELAYETSQEVHSRATDAMFVDVDGADDLLGYVATPLAGTQIVQDDSASTLAGTWGTSAGGLSGTQHFTPSSNDPAEYRTATFAFSGLEPNATYEVAITWSASGSNSASSRFTVRDPLGAGVLTTLVNQTVSPADFTADGATWKRLGRVVSLGSTLTVVLDNSNPSYYGNVVADGVRLVKLAANGGLDDNFRVLASSPSIDAADPLTAFDTEPAPNGNRANLGHTGNTPDATTSPTKFIQVLAPTDISKVEVGQASTVTWRNFGLPGVTVPPGVNAAYDAGPLAYYRLGDPAGATAFDLSPSALAGAYQGGVTQSITGIAGSDAAASFDGIDDRVQLAGGFSNFSSGFTFSTWVYPTANSYFGALLDLGNGTPADRIFVQRYANGDQLEFFASGQSLYAPPGTLTPNVWQHLAVTITSDKTARIYKNGTQIAMTALPAMPNETTRTRNFLGSRSDATNAIYRWAGGIDEAAIYSRALTPAEITSLTGTGNYGTISPLGSAKLDLYQNGTFVQSISAGTPNLGSFAWSVPGGLPTGPGYQVQVSTLDGSVLAKSASFRVVPGGTQFYVSTTGSNTNSGRLPGEPMRTLRALMAAYDLDAGDVVNVAAGNYRHVTNVILDSEDSGVRIIGPAVGPGALPLVTINRGNSTIGNAAFQASGADDVTIEDITATGGRDGVWVPGNSGTDRLTLKRLRLAGNSNAGLFAESGNNATRLENSVATGNAIGLYLFRVPQSLITGAEVFGNTGSGVEIDGNTLTGANQPRIENSSIHDNASYGILGYYGVNIAGNQITANGNIGLNTYGTNFTVTGNSVSKHTTSHGIYNLYADSTTLIEGNKSFLNATGIRLDSSSSAVRNNRVYGNAGAGIGVSGYGAAISGNSAYSNSIGIDYYSYANNASATIENNLVYANTNIGIRSTGTLGRRLVNNTAYQPVGDAIRLENSPNSILLNNIAWSDAGYGLYVDSASQTGLLSDSNLFHQGPGASAFLGFWSGTSIETLADWRTATGQDASSVEGSPLFVDRDGADNVLGYVATGGGFDGGPDDNFVPGSASPVIDRANLWNAPLTDITGNGRSDDPATANLGRDYVETALGSSGFAVTGIGQNWNSTNTYWNLNLPFSFPLYGDSYSTVAVTSEGYLYFSGPVGPFESNNSTAKLSGSRMIAPLWDNLRTDQAGDDIFIDNGTPNQTTIRWNATHETNSTDVNFSVTLFSTGEVRFHYGSGNTLLSPTIGLSRGDGVFSLESAISNFPMLTNANSRKFSTAAVSGGIADIGAYEFRGNSNDTVPPQIVGTVPANVHAAGIVYTAMTSIALATSEPLNAVSALAVAAYSLRSPGGNMTFGDGDDVLYSLTPSYVPGSTTVTLAINIPNPLAPGSYRLTANNVFDLAGNNLDGDGNGMGGDTYSRIFTVANNGITVTPSTLTTSESGTTAQFTVVLDTQPTADVTIPLTNGDTTEGTLSTTALVFTNANWDLPQTVTVTGVDDALIDGNITYTIFTDPATSTDPRYNGFNAADVSVTNNDNDSATPVVTSFIVNDGAGQRSRLTKIVVNFASPVEASLFQTLGAVTLTRTGISSTNQGTVGTVVNLSNGLQIAPASGTVSSITLTFANVLNAGVEKGSLADGRWQMAILPAGYTSPNSPADIQLRRMFGNVNNDTTVDGSDFSFFPSFGAAIDNPFDWDGNNDIDGGTDFASFGNRFGYSLN